MSSVFETFKKGEQKYDDNDDEGDDEDNGIME